MEIQPVILSGGAGTRLWPLSRELFPKQLLNLWGDKSLLQNTLTRLATSSRDTSKGQWRAPIIVCNEEHRFMVAEQLRQIDIHDATIILEPVGRNTAPALTLAALYSQLKLEDAVLLVLPADHVIQNIAALHRAIDVAVDLAVNDAMVTFGIVADHAETGYGYIRRGTPLTGSQQNDQCAYAVAEFVEKPNLEKAQAYLASGDYYWNSGMFVMRASHWLSAIERFRPDIVHACGDAMKSARPDLDFYRIDQAAFAACPADSIDYAVMEKIASQDQSAQGELQAAVVALDAGWSDVGAWSALWDVSERDLQGNVSKGDVLLHECRNNYVNADNRLVSAVGVENLIIVETADAVLVANKQHSQQVKNIVDQLKQQRRPEHLIHRCVARPWGSYEGVVAGERFQVKRIVVKPGASLSLQMHHHRAEHWVVVRGTAKVTRGEETFLISENQSTYIPLGTVHRLENPGSLDLEIIEIQSGAYLGEDDIVRFEDNYGRSKTS